MKSSKTLRVAASRLDQVLADAAADEQARRKQVTEEEVQALRAAVARLDQLLTDIAEKEATGELKQQPARKAWPSDIATTCAPLPALECSFSPLPVSAVLQIKYL